MTSFGDDLNIKDDCNINNQSYSELGYSYELPADIYHKSE